MTVHPARIWSHRYQRRIRAGNVSRIDSPPEVYLNGVNLGPVSLALPELADPGYRGEMEPLVKDMHFQYTGWLRAQKVVPAASLKVGNNDLIIVNGSAGSTSTTTIAGLRMRLVR